LPLFFVFPLWQRGIKGDLKSLSFSLYKREKSSLQGGEVNPSIL